jgi:hypothetical protein
MKSSQLLNEAVHIARIHHRSENCIYVREFHWAAASGWFSGFGVRITVLIWMFPLEMELWMASLLGSWLWLHALDGHSLQKQSISYRDNKWVSLPFKIKRYWHVVVESQDSENEHALLRLLAGDWTSFSPEKNFPFTLFHPNCKTNTNVGFPASRRPQTPNNGDDAMVRWR